MLWIHQYKQAWRLAALGLLVVAILGPWWFDRINVPVQYACSAPNIRLEGDFCGTPMPIAYFIFFLIVGSIELAIRWAQGAAVPAFDRSLLMYVLLVLVLPLFTTLPLLLRGNRRPWQVLQVFAWALSVIPALLFGMQGPLSWGGTLWGGWLYLGVAAGAFVLEFVMLVRGKDLRGKALS